MNFPYVPHMCTDAPIVKMFGPKSIIFDTLQRYKRIPKSNHSKKNYLKSDVIRRHISKNILSEIPPIGKMFGPKSIIFDTLQTCAKNSKIEPFKKILFEE